MEERDGKSMMEGEEHDAVRIGHAAVRGDTRSTTRAADERMFVGLY